MTCRNPTPNLTANAWQSRQFTAAGLKLSDMAGAVRCCRVSLLLPRYSAAPECNYTARPCESLSQCLSALCVGYASNRHLTLRFAHSCQCVRRIGKPPSRPICSRWFSQNCKTSAGIKTRLLVCVPDTRHRTQSLPALTEVPGSSKRDSFPPFRAVEDCSAQSQRKNQRTQCESHSRPYESSGTRRLLSGDSWAMEWQSQEAKECVMTVASNRSGVAGDVRARQPRCLDRLLGRKLQHHRNVAVE